MHADVGGSSMDGANRATLNETVYWDRPQNHWNKHWLEQPFSASVAKYPQRLYTHGQIYYSHNRLDLLSVAPIIYTFHLFIGNLQVLSWVNNEQAVT